MWPLRVTFRWRCDHIIWSCLVWWGSEQRVYATCLVKCRKKEGGRGRTRSRGFWRRWAWSQCHCQAFGAGIQSGHGYSFPSAAHCSTLQSQFTLKLEVSLNIRIVFWCVNVDSCRDTMAGTPFSLICNCGWVAQGSYNIENVKTNKLDKPYNDIKIMNIDVE